MFWRFVELQHARRMRFSDPDGALRPDAASRLDWGTEPGSLVDRGAQRPGRDAVKKSTRQGSGSSAAR